MMKNNTMKEKDYRDLLNISEAKETRKNVIEVWTEWDSNDGDYIERSCTIESGILFGDKKLIYCLAYVTLDPDFKMDENWERDCARFSQYVPDNSDISHLLSVLGRIGFIAYTDWGPCHSLVDWSLTWYNESSTPYEISFGKIYEEFRKMTYQEICDYINSL